MQLITKEVAAKLPKLYTTDGAKDEEKKIPLKLFNPSGAGTRYVFEASAFVDTGADGYEEKALSEVDLNDPRVEDVHLFAYVTGLGYDELGTVSLNELKSVKLPFGLGIERDIHWDPDTTFDAVK